MAKANNGEGHPSLNGESDARAALLKSSAYDRGEMTKAKRAAAKDRFLKHTPAEQEVIMSDWEKHDETKQALAEAQAEILLLKEQIEDQKTELQDRADQITELLPFKANKEEAFEREVQIRLAAALEKAVAEHDKKKKSTYKKRTSSLKNREEQAKLAEEAAKAAEERAKARLDEVENLGALRAKAERLDKIEEELKSQLTTAQTEVERLREELNNSMASVSEETARELTDLQEQVKKLTAELETTVREKGDKHLELNKARDEIQRLTKFEAEADSLKSKLAEIQAEIKTLNESIAAKETARVESEAKVTQLTIDLNDCKRQYRILNASYNSLQDNMKARAEDIENLREQLGL